MDSAHFWSSGTRSTSFIAQSAPVSLIAKEEEEEEIFSNQNDAQFHVDQTVKKIEVQKPISVPMALPSLRVVRPNRWASSRVLTSAIGPKVSYIRSHLSRAEKIGEKSSQYLFVATYTLPNVPRPISFPFCHWPLEQEMFGLLLAVDNWDLSCGPGGRGNGWALRLPSYHVPGESLANLGWCIGNVTLLGLFALQKSRHDVGLWIGEWSALFVSLLGSRVGHPLNTGGDLGGLIAGLEGALLAGVFSLKLCLSKFRFLENPRLT